jgi:K+-transporting ATPase ATPase A chain
MTAAQYAICFVVFGLTCTLFLYAILRFQRFLPWYFPKYATTPLSPDLSFNKAVSFSTTTTWQAYAGETTMRYFSQMVVSARKISLPGPQGWQWALPLYEALPGNLAQLSETSGLI